MGLGVVEEERMAVDSSLRHLRELVWQAGP